MLSFQCLLVLTNWNPGCFAGIMKIRCLFRIILLITIVLAVNTGTICVVSAADHGITVNNYVTEPEKAFTAEDLRRILDKSLSVDEINEPVDTDKNVKPEPDEETYSDNEVDEHHYYIPSKEDEWMLLLVNKQNPIPDDYAPELTDVNGSIKIRSEIALPLSEMFDAAEKDGVSLRVCSAYRSHEYQQGLFNKKIRNYTGRGLSYLDAFRIGSYSVIIPGTSEHELGMALDIVTPGYMNLNEGFAQTAAGKWLEKNAYKYGFILRYPKGKEYITGIIFEPWHYRYVGKEAAKAITENGLTLEEYVEEIGYK